MKPLERFRRGLKNLFQNMRMQYKLLLLFMLLSFLPLLVAVIYASTLSSQTIRAKTSTYSRQLVTQVSMNLDTSLQKIKGYSDDFILAPAITNRMFGYRGRTEMDQLNVRNYFSIELQLRFLNIEAINDVLLILYKDEPPAATIPAYDTAQIAQSRWAADEVGRLIRLNEDPANTRNLTLTVASVAGSGAPVLVMGRKIIHAATGEVFGQMLIALDPAYFSDIYARTRIGDSSQICIVDESGTVLSSLSPDLPPGQLFPSPELVQRIQTAARSRSRASAGLAGPAGDDSGNAGDTAGASDSFPLQLGGTGFQVTSAAIGTSGLQAILLVPDSYLNAENAQFVRQMLVLTFVILVLAVFFSFLLARGIASPLRELAASMGQLGEGGSFRRLVVKRNDEIGDLERSFNAMSGAIEDLVARIETENKIRRLSELQVLEYQINPHFLYNALDAINWMAQKAAQPEVSAMITALARFYRLGLSKGKEVYTIRDELDHVRNFLVISRLRHQDSFQFQFAVDPEILSLKTLRIILQPLVENAIKHGMRGLLSGAGLIRIAGTRRGDLVILTVEDNGRGIEPARLQYLNTALAAMQEISAGENGFGLLNVHQRLRLRYGEPCGVVLESQTGQGTIAKITIPVNR